MLALDFSVLLLWIHGFGWEEFKLSAAHALNLYTHLPTHTALILPWSPNAGHRLKRAPDRLCEDIVRSAELRVISG